MTSPSKDQDLSLNTGSDRELISINPTHLPTEGCSSNMSFSSFIPPSEAFTVKVALKPVSLKINPGRKKIGKEKEEMQMANKHMSKRSASLGSVYKLSKNDDIFYC